MKSIDMTRFGQTIMWSVISEKKQYIKNFLMIFTIYLILMCAATGLFSGYNKPVNIMHISIAVSTCSLAWLIFGGLATGDVFGNLRTKQSRTMFFMLPATNQEKYWSRVLLTMVQALILSTVALVAADLVQMALSSIFAGNAMSVTKVMYENFITFGTYSLNVHNSGIPVQYISTLSWISTICCILWLVSSYILGGTIFKKVPGILTTLCWFVIWIVLAIALVNALNRSSLECIEWMDGTTGNIVTGIIGFGFFVFNMWLSYRLFTKMQITPGKYLHI